MKTHQDTCLVDRTLVQDEGHLSTNTLVLRREGDEGRAYGLLSGIQCSENANIRTFGLKIHFFGTRYNRCDCKLWCYPVGTDVAVAADTNEQATYTPCNWLLKPFWNDAAVICRNLQFTLYIFFLTDDTAYGTWMQRNPDGSEKHNHGCFIWGLQTLCAFNHCDWVLLLVLDDRMCKQVVIFVSRR